MNFRVATLQDEGGIKTLSKGVYEDTDTLCYDLTKRLKSDMWVLFVGEVNSGKIVAFTAINITDGGDSLVVRSSRVDAEYRGQGVYKALVNFAFRFIRERNPQAKCVWRVRSADIKVPDGYEVITRFWLVRAIFKDFSKSKIEKLNISETNIKVITWCEFKMIYESDDTMINLLNNGVISIYGCVFRLSCEANWSYLQSRTDIHLMLSKYEDDAGKAQAFMSFLRLEKSFTNTGVPMIAMNLYGVDKEALKCHLAKGLLELLNHVDNKFLFSVSVDNELVKDCVNLLEEFSSGDVAYQSGVNLLLGNLNTMTL